MEQQCKYSPQTGILLRRVPNETNLMIPARYVLLAASLLLFASQFPTPAIGQVSSNSSGTDFYNAYANSDPLGGQPEQTPTTIGPNESNECIPPNPDWQLVAQKGNTCYWYAPFAKPLNDFVVPLAKMSWVESSGGTCGVNPFSNPNKLNGTAICDLPAPQNNPYAPPSPSVGGPVAPPTDYFSSNPYNPSRLLADYKEIITVASRGNPRQTSQQIAPQLQEDMTACSKYAAQGILSPACCTDLGQAANFNMEGSGPARQESKMYQRGAETACTFQVPDTPLIATGPNPHFYTVVSDGSPPQKMTNVLAENPDCQQWSETQIICQNTPSGGPPIIPKHNQLQAGTSQTCYPADLENGLYKEWLKWCDQWKDLFNKRVFLPLDGRWYPTQYPFCYGLTFTIYSDGRFKMASEQIKSGVPTEPYRNLDSQRAATQFSNEVTMLVRSLQGQVPPFPAGSTLKEATQLDDILIRCEKR
jgi:hypothetical protein